MKNDILAIITARGGSKGIPGKNIKNLGGKPLLCWTIEAANSSSLIDRLILSSDDLNIQRVASLAGCEVPFTRPAELATDESGSVDVLIHALNSLNTRYKYLLVLQPTSPFRTTKHIDDFLQFSLDKDADISVSVSKLKKHPMFMYEECNGRLKSFISCDKQLRRQDMPPAYEHNGALYFAKTEYFIDRKSFNTDDAIPFVTEGPINLDLDTLDDWDYAEYLIAKGKAYC